MLAMIAGVDREEAAQRLRKTVAITAAGTPAAVALARELKEQLERTVCVAPSGDADLEICIGAPVSRRAPYSLQVGLDSEQLVIGANQRMLPIAEPLDGLRLTFAGCYSAAPVLHHLLGMETAGYDPARGLFIVPFRALGIPTDISERTIVFEDVALAGAGAIGNGFLRALRHLKTRGVLIILDPKRVGSGNPNRCLYFRDEDVDMFKAPLLTERAQPEFPELTLKASLATFSQLVRERGRIRRTLVATDSRRARRTIQNDLPFEVIDASTTDIREIIVHSHRQPTDGACLACIYKHIPEENAREKEIARGLGISLEEIGHGFISEDIAEKIVEAHPDLSAAKILGMSFDSLFKQRCAEQHLLETSGIQVLAPFAFVSNLAGALLALELARFDSDLPRTNYSFFSPWGPPNPRARTFRAKDPECGFCSRPQAGRALRALWADVMNDLALA